MTAPVDTSAEAVLVRFGLQWNGPREFVSTPMADGYWTPWHVAHSALTAAHQRLSEQETLLAERNRQNAAAFADRDALLADQRRLLYLASTASMNWGHRDRAGYTLDPLQFESARDVIHPDDFRRAIDAAMAGPCPTCHGSGLVTIRGMCGGVEMDCDDQPCPDCEDIRGEAVGAKEGE